MKLISYELKKILSAKHVFIIIVCFIMVNLLLIWHVQNKRQLPSRLFYQQLSVNLANMTEKEQGSYLTDKGQEAFSLTGDLEDKEGQFWNGLFDNWEAASQYNNRLTKIEKDAKMLTSISIFQSHKNNSFSYRNIIKTQEDYQAMQGLRVPFKITEGICAAINAPLTDALLACMGFFLSLLLIFQERKRGLIAVLRATPKGRKELAISKLVALGIVMFFGVLLLYVSNICYCVYRYGGVDGRLPVQALKGFEYCPLAINIRQFLILYLLIKWLSIYAFSTIIVLVTIYAQNATTGFLAFAAIYGIGYAMAKYIPPLSFWGWLRFINPVGILDTAGIWKGYYNLNVGGYPVGAKTVVVIFAVLTIIVFGMLCIVSFSKKRNWETKELRLFQKVKKAPTSQAAFELYKLLVVNKGLVILILYGVLAVVIFPPLVPDLSFEQKPLKKYLNIIEGELNNEVITFMEEEEKTFQEAQEKIDWIMAQAEDGTIALQGAEDWATTYEGILLWQPFFDITKERVEYVQNHPGTQILYDDGFKQIMYQSGNPIILLTTLTTLILLFAEYLAMEYQSGIVPVLRAAPRGRQHTINRKIWCAVLINIVIIMIPILTIVIPVSTRYGLSGSWYSIRSIPDFADFPWNIPIIIFLLGHYLSQLLANIVTTLIILALSNRIQRTTGTISMSVAIFLVPIVLSLMKVSLLSRFSFIPFYHFATYMLSYRDRFIFFLTLLCWIGAAIVMWKDTYHCFGKNIK